VSNVWHLRFSLDGQRGEKGAGDSRTNQEVLLPKRAGENLTSRLSSGRG